MAKEEEKKPITVKKVDPKIYEGVDFSARVKFKALDGAKHHTPGEEYEGSEVLVRKLESKGHAVRIKK